ncbi:hypothetical protein MM_3370 [Methanosarcina mazei Go1]|uniref:Uncharacterized protein n=1 Tax=Methanosarcina mazei (strain ATCC BAA-159 / DSM 3647 / Goe1 / Go1 / JCM 11833 / OCM 88) TaxID=192952 RepID=Q8PRS3_METMA|nr:hypothetical protein MM_3370 [Methanosarcina mazei Go1]
MKQKTLLALVLLGVTALIREQDPLKQGLKPNSRMRSLRIFIIREQDPLKQGLKLNTLTYLFLLVFIREQDPLKQGLKQSVQFFSCQVVDGYSRARSTKTRIETKEDLDYLKEHNIIREQDPLKQGLKRDEYYFIITARADS